ncbi:hypothetical protein YQE_10230, partial [Dendroctonus ponderosae]
MFALNLLVVSVVSGGPAWKEVQRGGGLKIGEKGGRNASSLRGNGIKIGSGGRGLRSTTTTTTSVPEEEFIHPPTSPSDRNGGIKHLNIGIVLPYKSFGVRDYTKAITTTKSLIARKLKLFKSHDIQVHIVMKALTPSPTGEFH